MKEKINRHDLAYFGVRIASEHLNARKEFKALKAVFESKHFFESSPYPVKFSLKNNTIIFNKDWLNEADAFQILKYSFFIVFIYFRWDSTEPLFNIGEMSKDELPMLSEGEASLNTNPDMSRSSGLFQSAIDYSEKMIELFSDEELHE